MKPLRAIAVMDARTAVRFAVVTIAIVSLAYASVDLALRFSPIDPQPYLQADVSPIMLDRNDRLLHAYLNAGDSWCFPKDVSGYSSHLIDATIAAEDQRFWSHHGVDGIAILRASLQNAAERQIASGASTLTMQVVKLRGGYDRSLPGKIRQAWDALRLERAAPKDAIVSAYLNRAPYGYNLVGAEAAARRYFGKSSAELTLSEAALLAGLPKAPGNLDPLRHPDAAKARRDYVLRRMYDDQTISAAELQDALSSPITAAWHDLPMDAPHLDYLIGSGSRVRTTLDKTVQQDVQALLTRYIKQYDGNITNAAAIAIEVKSAEVLAYCGSADFLHSDGGQIDLARAPRSPGSTLKPFVYGLAMQCDRLYPSEMLLDDTLDYGDYNPANYDGKYNGLIPAEEALRYSLNVPAVLVLNRVGVADVQRTLRRMGLTTLDRAPAYYGLGLTLGDCEVRLAKLAAAYRALAAMGNYVPLRYTTKTKPILSKRIFDEDIAAALFEMLRQPLPKELPQALIQANDTTTPVAWKTGTSTGHHDAWAFVFNCQYVVGVWLGNADNRPDDRLVGAEAALPLAGAVFRALPTKSTPAWPDLTRSLRLVRVCSASGLPATAACPLTHDARIPRSMYLTRRCDIHRASLATNTVVERWPAGAKQWDLAAVPDPVSLAREDGLKQTTLRVASPSDDSEYVLTGHPGADRIRLRASLEYDQPIHWYCDGRYLGLSRTEAPLFLDLTAGEHTVACMTGNGATDSVRIKVDSASD